MLPSNTCRISVLGVVLSLSLVVLPSGACDHARKQSTRHIPVVEDLVQLLQERPDLRAALEGTIWTGDLNGLRDMDSLLIYLNGFVTLVPTKCKLPTALKLYYIVNQSPGDQLNRDKNFSAGMKKLIEAWGQFLDTHSVRLGHPFASGTTELQHRRYYFVAPSGWLTFNQFFAREVKPDKRPIAQPRNDRVIVSSADATFAGK